jgi:spore coat protein U-like protein
MFKKVLAAGALIACGSSAVQASTTTTTFNVTATVISSCSVSAADLAFGNYDPLAVLPTVGTSTVTVTCSLLAPYNIGLGIGINGTSVTARKMKVTGGGSDTLNYALTRDAAHLLNWGNTVGTDTLALVGTGLAVGSTVFGTIPAGQNVSVGSYTDTITVTVTF